ncbi:response regulator [Geitlerinema sp. PCC 7407]|uniref:response regulator n=1 Tax=Geitlerinema sp. PCC 7407 TaxID=1173025 RepID=UPI00029FD872|nr:response regulator [Geitlerinema sp. PCC 7407]AFY67141.1 CheA signal transduction histidine kinase [Geitlerinema sp. PCC 7407]
MQSEQQQRIMGYFIEEARDHLNTLEQGLLNLQSTLEDPEMLNELFRAAHSVKGGAAMLGIDSIQQTSHRLEDCFKILKEHPVKVDQDIESLLLSCLDTLQELLGQLQTPFGLTEEKAREIMAGVEPVFAELGSRLTQMVAATGGVITPETQETWIAPEAAASASAPVQAEEESALQLIFQSDVPRQLRDMLQLFKQADTLERRQQLQEICSGLKRTGEQFDLRNWCDLLESARLAIASPENTYHTLAPIVIREIKQGQELVLAGRSADIAVSPALQELLPVTAVTGELSLDAMFAESPSGELDFSAIADSSTNQAPAAVSASDLDFHKATGDRPGPEVGMAELNSLADLFEGDVPDLDITWEQEEILGSTADEILSSLDLDAASDFSDDFADLLFEESTASSSSAEDDLSGFLQAAEQREETAAIADLDFDLGDDSAGLFDDLLEPVTVEPPSDLSQPSGDLGDLFAEIDAVDLEAETPSAVSQPAPELAALGSLFGEMPVDDEELMTDLNEDSSSPFDEAEDLLQDDFGASFEDGLGDLGLDEELEGLDLLTEAQSGDADKVAESELDFSAALLEEPGESTTADEDFLDLGLEETAAIASPEDDLGNLFGSGLSQERTDQLGAAESSELANLFGGSAGESELTDNLFDGDAEAGDAFAEMSLDAFADSAEPAPAALSEVDETEAASASEDDFSGLDWDAAELDLAPESSAAEAEEAEDFADLAGLTDDTPVDGTGLELTGPELAWDAIESENAAADAAIDQALGLESFDLEEDAWDTPPEEATAPEAALFSETSAPEADVFGESSEAIAADDWELSPDDTQEPALGLEADLFEQSTGASTASETGTGNDWETFFDSDQKGDRSPSTSNEIEDFFGTDISETSLEASALTDFASTENLLSEEPAQPAAEAAIELEEDLWADQAAQTEAAALLDDSFAEAPDLDLGLADLAGEPAPETAASLDMEGATEAIADDFDLGFAAEELTAPEATAGEEDLGLDSLEEPELGLDLADTSEEAGALDFDLGLEAPIAETPEAADDLDFGLAADASDSLEFAAAEATDELDFGLDLTEEPESLGFEAAEADVLDFDLERGEPAELSFETEAATDDLGFDLSAADEFDLGFEAAEDSGELGLDLGDTDEFDLGLETAEETSELDFDLAAEATDDLGLDFGETEAATDELDFGLEETEAASELSFEPEGSEDLGFELGAGESEDLGFDLGAGEEAGDLDFDLGLEEPVAETAEAADELDFGLDLAEESETLDFGAAETTDELDFGLDLTEEPESLAFDAAEESDEFDLGFELGGEAESLDFAAAETTDELDFGLDLAEEPGELSFETEAATDDLGFDLGDTDEFDLGLETAEETSELDFDLAAEATDDLGLDFGETEAAADELDFGLEETEATSELSFEPEGSEDLGFDLGAGEEAGDLDFDLGLEEPVAETAEAADELDFGLDLAEESETLDFGAAETTDELDFGLDLTEEPESLAFDAAEESDEFDLGFELGGEAESLDFASAETTDELDFGLDLTEEPGELSFETEAATDDLGFDLGAADEFDLGFETAEDSGELGLDLGDTDEFDLGLETTEETSELDFDLAAEATDDLGLDFGETEAAADELDFGLEETEAASELSFDLEGSESLSFDLGAGESEDLGFDLGAGEEAGDLDFDLGLEEPVAETAEAADELDFGLDLAEESEALDFGAAETTDELDFGLDLTEEPESLAFDAAEESDEFDLGFELGGEAESLDFAAAETTDELDFGLDLAEEPAEPSFETEAAADDLGFDLGAEESLSLDDDLGDLFGTEASEVGEGESSAMFDFELGEESAATADDFGLDGAVTSDGLIFGMDEGDADLTESLFGAGETDTFEGDLFGLESAEMGGIETDLSFDDDLLAIADEVPAFLADDTGAIAVTETLAPEEARELESLLAEESSLPLETGDRQVFDELAALLDDGTIAVPAIAAPHVTQIDIESDIDNEFADLEKLLEDADNTLGPSTKAARGPAPTLSRRPRGLVEQTMRVPVKHLDNLNNLVGELVVNRNSLEQDQERLRQFLDNLLYQVQQLSDVGQRMRDLYERSLLESSLLSSRRTHQIAPGSHKKGDSNAFHATGENFDALEMDRFTSFHTLSQEMIELIVRVREASSDIEYIVDETDQVTRSFRQVTTQLQEGLNRSRMVPFAQIADRLPRAVRDIAMKCGKQAELVIEGRDTLIDKMILEQLYDPMTHLVNNAITHGIEAPDVRKASGKAPTGRITVRAFHQGNQTVISVSDDGAGIPVDRVKAKAVERGLVTPVEAKQMSRLDVYDLLFHPGFSIRDKADDFAGRGIGMDVVRTSLNEIRGAINTDSTLGRGTNFTIRLPLTLSISKALCCISNHARIAFPMDGVEDMLDLPKDRIQTNAEGQPCILWRDTMLPFRPLTELLRHNRFLGRGSVYGGHQDDDIISIVVLRSAGTFIALQVDQVLGEQEIVIKQLEGPVPKPAGVAGATVLGDGRIMPIADVLELIDLALGRARRDVGGALWEEGDQVPVEPPVVKTEPTVLIVDDSITVRELLSMTFNKSGYRVEQARDGQEAWEKLRSGLPCDLVFCDIEMPRMDGLELLSRMQKDPSLNRLPIAMLTSRGADRHRQMAVQLGARGYFTKPYLEEALLDAAQRMLKGEVLVGSK